MPTSLPESNDMMELRCLAIFVKGARGHLRQDDANLSARALAGREQQDALMGLLQRTLHTLKRVAHSTARGELSAASANSRWRLSAISQRLALELCAAPPAPVLDF